jgi:alkaline phosphatase
MRLRSFSFLIGLSFIAFTACSIRNVHTTGAPAKTPRNIILLIGDGMGIAHVNAAITISAVPLALETFPFSGFSKTFSHDNYVTDSGAGGTAIASGVKTRNGMIGMGPDSVALESIMDLAHRKGLATGLVSTSSITHATPASFVAHNIDRDNYEEIATDFLKGTIDVFIGGGEDQFRNRRDGVDLTAKLAKQGYDVVYTIDDLKKSTSNKLAGLLAKDHMPQELSGRRGMLEVMTSKAIETLSRNKKGFVLMVEGSQIDWGSHANDIRYVASEMLDFDRAVEVAKQFAESNRETLVVVTADHETGGLTLMEGSEEEHWVSVLFSTTDHTGVMVPVFSYGPGAERFSGIHDNTFYLPEFLDLLGIKKSN